MVSISSDNVQMVTEGAGTATTTSLRSVMESHQNADPQGTPEDDGVPERGSPERLTMRSVYIVGGLLALYWLLTR